MTPTRAHPVDLQLDAPSAGLRQFVIRFRRLMLRVGADAGLLIDDYPPFALCDANAQEFVT